MKKDKPARKKLTLSRQTIRTLGKQQLAHVAGGGPTSKCDPTRGTETCTDLGC